MVYTDIHTHIIPGVDDGASDMQEAVEMLKLANAEGINAIIATPHFGLSNPDYDYKKAEKNFEALKQEAAAEFPDMKLYMGNEIFWSSGVIDCLRNGEAKTLAETEYVLLEFDPDEKFYKIETAVEDCLWNGYIPILAHAERYEAMEGRPDKMQTLIKKGVLMQVNCRSLIRPPEKHSFFRKKSWQERIYEHTMNMMENEYIHFLASDAHGAKVRVPVFESAVSLFLEGNNGNDIKKIIQNSDRMINKEML